MGWIFLGLYYVGCIVAFLIIEYKNKDNKNVDGPMMCIAAAFSWLVVAIMGLRGVVNKLTKK